ncbi:MAG: hypothetical protein ACYDDS_03475 [Candidatus Sulfotelmatobacter sp.]
MQDEKKERWMELCAQAAIEQDPEKLHALVEEIDRLLQEKEDRLKKYRLKEDRVEEHPPAPR